MEFKKGASYLRKKEDGTIMKLSSAFSVQSGGILYLTLYGSVAGEEELGEFRVPSTDFIREVTWQEWFNRWIEVRVERFNKEFTNKLEEALK